MDICEPKIPQDEFLNNYDDLYDPTPLECHRQYPTKGICSSSTQNIKNIVSSINKCVITGKENCNECCFTEESLNRKYVSNRTSARCGHKGAVREVHQPCKSNMSKHSPKPARSNSQKRCCFAEPEVVSCCACPDDVHDEVPPTSIASVSSASGSQSDNVLPTSEENCSCKSDIEMLRGLTEISNKPVANSEKMMSCTACAASPKLFYSEYISEVSRVARTHGVFAPAPTSTSGTDAETDQSHLHTISERTEATSDDASQITDEIPLVKPKKLIVQHLPQINIRPSLTTQKVFEIEIKPSGSVQLQIPTIPNIYYEEVLRPEEDRPQESLYDFLTKHLSNTETSDDNIDVSSIPEMKIPEPEDKPAKEVDTPKAVENKDIPTDNTSVCFIAPASTATKQEEDIVSEDRRPCLKEQETAPMNKMKSNVSFKQVPEAKVISGSDISAKDTLSVAEDTSSEVEVRTKLYQHIDNK